MIIQIGFNKCATTALFQLFRDSGYAPLHSNGRYWRQRNHPQLDGVMVQEQIASNIEKGRKPFAGFEAFDAFFDMELSSADQRIANYRHFAVMAETYPDALFILNTRDPEDWLRSRARHHDGLYLSEAQAFYGLSADDVIRKWAEDFRAHNAAVLSYFQSSSDRLCHFNTDVDPISKVVDFVATVRPIDPRFWTVARVTDTKAADRGWADTNRDLDIAAILQGEKAA